MAVGDTIAKNKLSASTSGKGIKVGATSTPGTTIHTAVSGDTNWDEIWCWATCATTTATKLTMEYGGTTSPDNTIEKNISGEDGHVMVIPGHILNGGLSVKAFAATADVIMIYGYVHNLSA